MTVERIFVFAILIQIFTLVLIIAWGAHVQSYNPRNFLENSLIDIGGISFSLFSILYFINLYLLYKKRNLGKKLFVPMVFIFIIFSFTTELLNPSQFLKDLFYLFIFYIISPAFFIGQGILISIIYLTDLKNKFSV